MVKAKVVARVYWS